MTVRQVGRAPSGTTLQSCVQRRRSEAFQPDARPPGGPSAERDKLEQVWEPFRANTTLRAPRLGLEPRTYRLTAGCSAIELPRKEPALHSSESNWATVGDLR